MILLENGYKTSVFCLTNDKYKISYLEFIIKKIAERRFNLGGIQFSEVTKLYKKKEVLHNITFDIDLDDNKIIGLIGPNGAGKSTILRLLAGVIGYQQGTLSLDNNQSAIKFDQWARRHATYLPAGERGMIYKATVLDNIYYLSSLNGTPKKNTVEHLKKYSDLFGFDSYLDKNVEELSTGLKKKAQLLCALCSDSKLLLLDEPSNGLDIKAQLELKKLITEINEKEKKKIIISSHDTNLMSSLCNEVIFIHDGHIKKIINNTISPEEIELEYQSIEG